MNTLDEKARKAGWIVSSMPLFNGRAMHFYERVGSNGVRAEFSTSDVLLWLARTSNGWIITETAGPDLSATAADWLSLPREDEPVADADRMLDWLRAVTPGVVWERRQDEFCGKFFDPTRSRVSRVVERLKLGEAAGDASGRTWIGVVDGWSVRVAAMYPGGER